MLTETSELDALFEHCAEIDDSDLARARSLAQAREITLDRAVLSLGLMAENRVLGIVARSSGIEFCESPDLAGLAPSHALLRRYQQDKSIVVVEDDERRFLVFASDPANERTRRELEFYLEGEIKLIATTSRAIDQLHSAFDTGPDDEISQEQKERDLERVDVASTEAPVVRQVNQLLSRAVDERASDVHFEVQEDGLRVRFRIDGRLTKRTVDRSLRPDAVLARVKVLAGLNVSERRLPQDGRIELVIAGRSVDFRVSSVPTQYGESVVCRVLDPGAQKLDWTELGFDRALAKRIRALIERPSGLFLVTGPTGSGKTTTLYTALTQLNTLDRKIITVEDPIEYSLDGIEQVQVDASLGLTFARVLRSVLRQDPDVLMIGEIRDGETAEIACRAALVGRLVLSTLHTGSPDAAKTRLLDLGVEQYLVDDVLVGVLGQRLVPTQHGDGRVLTSALRERER